MGKSSADAEMDQLVKIAKTSDEARDMLAQVLAESVVNTLTISMIPTKIMPPFTESLPTYKTFVCGATVDLGYLWAEENVATPPTVLLEELHHEVLAEILTVAEREIWGWLRELGFVHDSKLALDNEVLKNERAALWIGSESLFDSITTWQAFKPVGPDVSPGGFLGKVLHEGAEYVVLSDIFRYDTLRIVFPDGQWAYIGESESPHLNVLPSIKVESGTAKIQFEITLALPQ